MTHLRVLIADDEPLARRTLAETLGRADDVELVAQAGDGPALLAALRRHVVDVAFLDIEMPGGHALSVLERAEREGRLPPGLVFVTAHADYAVRAFEQGGLDYVLKPYEPGRLLAALDRARRRRIGDAGLETLRRVRTLVRVLADEKSRGSAPANDAVGALLDLIEEPLPPDAEHELVFERGARLVRLRASEVAWVRAADNYSEIFVVTGETHLVRSTLAAMERRLPPDAFVRIHRSAIVRLDHVAECVSSPGGEAEVVLCSGARLPVSRLRRKTLLARLRALRGDRGAGD